MNILLETKHLIVRIPTVDDIEDQYALQSDPEVMKYVGIGLPRSLNEVKESLNKCIQHQTKHGFSLGSVFEKETGQFVGRAGLIYLAFDDTQPEIEIGYALMKPYWNKGYATELAKALIQWGFSNLNIDKLVAVTRPENLQSRRVLEKAGMDYLGLSKYNNNEVTKYEILRIKFEIKLKSYAPQ